MNKKFSFSILIISVISFIGHLFIYTKLPDIIPIHWGKNGIDGYGPKYMDIVLALIPIVVYIFLILVPKLDPKKQNYKKHEKAYDFVIGFTNLFLILLSWATALVSLGYPIHIDKIVQIGIGVLFIIIGNYMPQIRQNYFFGIRTPWAIENEYVWKKTQHLGGIMFVISGILFIILGILMNKYFITVIILDLVAIVLIPYIYSYVLFKKEMEKLNK